MNMRSAIAGTVLIAMVCVIAVMVTSDGQNDTLVLESVQGNAELKEEKAHAESELSKLDSLKAVIQKAVKDPTDANMGLAMNAQKELQGLMTHTAPAKTAPAPVQVHPVQPVAAVETKDISTESRADLKKTKADALSGMAKLDSLKAIIHKATVPGATAEDQKAGMAAAQQLQGLLTHKNAPAPVAKVAPVQQVETAKPVITGHESNTELRAEKQDMQSDVDKLAHLKDIIHKAMAPGATPEDQKAAMAAAQQMQGLMSHKASAPVAPAQPAVAVETSQPAKPEDNKHLEEKKEAEESELNKLAGLKSIIHHAMSHPDEAGAMDKAKAAAAKLQSLMTHQASPMPDAPSVEPLDEPEVSAEPQQVTDTEPLPEASKTSKQNKLKGGSKSQISDLKALLEKAKANPTQENMNALMALQAKIASEKAKKSDTPEVVTGAAAKEVVEEVQTTPVVEEKPVAFNLDIDGLGSIPVHAGDKADALAKDFAKAHNLKEKMQKKLQAMIEQQMSANGL